MSEKTQVAITHPKINEFVELVDETAPDGIPDIDNLLKEPFLKYCRNWIIYHHKPEISDFLVTYFGSEVVESYGEDWTQRLLSKSDFEKGYDTIYRINLEIIDGHEMVADSGTLDLQDRTLKNWYEIKMPLKRNGEVNEVLVFMCFD
jgi:hypothetical protein